MSSQAAVTGLLVAATNGDRAALDEMLPLVYAELFVRGPTAAAAVEWLSVCEDCLVTRSSQERSCPPQAAILRMWVR